MPVFLVQIDGYDPVAAAAVSLRASSLDDDRVCHVDGASGVFWPAVAQLPELRYDLVDASFSGWVGTPSSQIVLAVEPFPNLPRYQLSDARVRIWSGNIGDAWGSYTLRFDGRCTAQPNVADGRASLTIAVDDRWLDTPLLALYTGTTGVEGDAALKGQPKPLSIGAPRFAPGRLIDGTNLVFQLSSYLIEDVEVAFERILRYSASAGNYASYAALVAATVRPGEWATAKAVGMVRHGAPPVPGGRFVYHIKGDKAGPDGWVRLPGSIIKRLALIAGGAGRYSAASLTALDAARPWNVSWHIVEQMTAREAIQRIAASVNAFAGVSWLSQLFVAPLPSLVGSPAVTLNSDGTTLPPVGKVDQIEMDPPFWRMSIETEKTWDVHQYSDVAFTAILVDRGVYVSTETYREGHITQDQNSSWLYINPTATSGNAPPTLPTASNAYWKSLSATDSIAATLNAANDGVLTKNEKITDLLDADKSLRARMHALLLRAASLGVLAASQNQLVRSEEFDNASWTKAGGGTGSAPSVTANAAVAPDGTTTADRITFARGANATSSDYSYVELNIGSSVAAATAVSARVFVRSANGQKQMVNALMYLSADGAAATKTMEVGNDWVELELNAATVSSSDIYFSIGVRAGTLGGFTLGGDRNLDLYVWGAQIDVNRFCRPYVRTTTAGITQGAAGTAADAVYNAYAAYRDSMEFAYPAWDDITVDSTIYPAETLTAQPFDFTNAAWTKASLTAARTGLGSYDWFTLTDASGNYGEINQAVAVMPGRDMTAMLKVKKDATGKATRFAYFAVLNGAFSAEVAAILFDTNTGEIATFAAGVIAGSAAIDCGTFWLIQLNFNTGSEATIYPRIIPAAGSGNLTTGNMTPAKTGSIIARHPILFYGALTTFDRQSLRNRVASFGQKMDDLARAIGVIDGTTSLTIDGPAAVTIDATSAGDASGSLPISLGYVASVGSASVTSAAAWTATVISASGSVTCSIGASTGTLSTTALATSTASVRIDCTYGGVTKSKTLAITRNDALPATGGGGTSPSASTTGLSSINSTSFATVATLVITAASAAPSLSASALTCSPTGAIGSVGSWNVEMKWVRENGVTDVDIGSTANSSPDPEVANDAEGHPAKNSGAITCNATDSGRSVGVQYTYYLQAKLTSGSRTIGFAGTASVTS